MIIVTRYDDKYEPYKPFWEYCINRAYPEYSYHAHKSDHPSTDRLLIDPYPSHIEDSLQVIYHDYHYITDIDMMILPETPSLKDFHLKEMSETGLCYSNSSRVNTAEPEGANRMTGLHFVGFEWFEATEKARYKYWQEIRDGKYNRRFDDEVVLMNVIKDSGLGIAPPKKLMTRHHGIHLGTGRTYRHDKSMLFQNLAQRIIPEKAKQWQTIQGDPVFKALILKAPEWLQKEFYDMDRFTRRRMKQEG